MHCVTNPTACHLPPATRHTQEALLSIQSDRYKAEYAYLAWLSRCCIMNGNPHFAWELYLQVRPFTIIQTTPTPTITASSTTGRAWLTG